VSFKPFPAGERWYAIAVLAALLGLDVVLVLWLMDRPVDGLSFLAALTVLGSLLVFVYVGFRVLGAFTLEYWVDRDAITLKWGPTRQIVPLPLIQRVQINTMAPPSSPPRIWHWPCPERRRYSVSGVGVVNAYATHPLAEQIVLVTDGESYGLSPEDAPGFVRAMQERHALGPARLLAAELQRPPLWTWPLWRDRAAMILMGAGLLAVLVMFGVLCFRFPSLSSDLPLHFDINGLPDRIAPKAGLFALPMIGLVTWILNTAVGVWLYRHIQHGAAYLLWGGALAVQGIVGLALFNLMRW
jgi:hypothetical protein